MDTTLLVRMRQTCSMVDSFVEKNRRKFAARPHLGIYLKIALRDDVVSELIFILSCKRLQEEVFFYHGYFEETLIAATKVYDEKLERMLSGISFWLILLVSIFFKCISSKEN